MTKTQQPAEAAADRPKDSVTKANDHKPKKLEPEKLEPEKLDLATLDIAAEKRAELLRVFPEARTEGGKIDFDRLRLVLGDAVDTGKERYGMNWPGKADCFKAIQRPSLGTLLPARDESVNFDETENLIIEGDNLEVLKLLQKSYQGKVKMIYIDPPYNTGNDFIYPDNYAESLQTYLEYTGQVDSEGRKFSTNSDTDGRFHSKWLNMMYPRLYLARNLLREDGVIFISIDDTEVDDLRKLCSEIFGEEEFCSTFIRQKKNKPAFLHTNVGSMTEYVICFTRDKDHTFPFCVDVTTAGKSFPLNNAGNPLKVLRFSAGSVRFGIEDGVIEPQNMSEGNIVTRLLDRVTIENGANKDEFRLEGEWRYSQERLTDVINSGETITISKLPFRPNHVRNGGEPKKMHNLLTPQTYQAGTNEDGTEEVRQIFRGDYFDNPKPTSLIRLLALAVTYQDPTAIILDFFAGSGTTAQAVLDLNREDHSNRKFILVQLPEPTGREDFKTIAEITKERVRRVIARHEKEAEGKLNLGDRPKEGFRVLKLAESNFHVWSADTATANPETLAQQLELHVHHILPGRTSEDLLTEVLLKSGFPLTTPIETLTLAGKTVYSVTGYGMLICLERELTHEAIKAMAERRPTQVVCLDEGFTGNDQLKTNAVLIMRSKGVTKFQTI